jgi:hypothetical protein
MSDTTTVEPLAAGPTIPTAATRGPFNGSVAITVTPSDTVVQYFNGLHNATATGGAIAITDMAGNVATFYVAAGGYLSCACSKVMATNTAVTSIIGLN